MQALRAPPERVQQQVGVTHLQLPQFFEVTTLHPSTDASNRIPGAASMSDGQATHRARTEQGKQLPAPGRTHDGRPRQPRDTSPTTHARIAHTARDGPDEW